MTAVSVNHSLVADEELVRQVAKGHNESLGLLFDRYHRPLRRFLSRLGIATSDLDDLVQQTFLEVPRAAGRFQPDRSVKGWLFGLAAFVVKRHRRSLMRIARKIAAFSREPFAKEPPTPSEMVGEEESVRRASEALDKLSKKKRDVFVMVVIERLPGEAVAQALRIPVGTVWTRLHHARRELRALLGENES